AVVGVLLLEELADPPEQLAGEDAGAVVHIDRDDLLGGELRPAGVARACQAQRDQPARRGPRDHVEELGDRATDRLLDVVEDRRGNHAADPAAVDRENLGWHRSPLAYPEMKNPARGGASGVGRVGIEPTTLGLRVP